MPTIASSAAQVPPSRIREETKVGIAPGVAFGAGGEGSARICYASDRSILEPAMERLARFLGGYEADAKSRANI